MRLRITALTLLAAGLAFAARPASALHLDWVELTPTCTGFTLLTEGRTYENLQIGYSLTVALSNGTTETVSGTFPVNYPGDLITGWGFDFRKSYAGTWGFTISGSASITGRVELQSLDGVIINWEDTLQYKDICPPVTVDCPCTCRGTATPGYWKNHPDSWPVETLVIGGQTYTREELIAILCNGGRGDKTYTLFHALLAARLNILSGCSAACVTAAVTAADEWLVTYPLDSNVRGSSRAWRLGEPLSLKLDMYNNGLLCVRSRSFFEAKAQIKRIIKHHRCFPNPFNPSTSITFTLTEPERVTVKIYNALGAEVATLANGSFAAGNHTLTWNARTLASGIYFCRIVAGGEVSTTRLLFMK